MCANNRTIGGVRAAGLRRLAACGCAGLLAVSVGGAGAAQFGVEGGGVGSRSEFSRRSGQPVTVSVTPSAQPGSATKSSSSVVVNDNGRVIKVEVKDNVVVLAEVDGKTIPDERIENDGQTVRLKDEKGEVIYELGIGGAGAMGWSGVGGIDPSDPVWSRFTAVSPQVFSLGRGGSGLGAYSRMGPEGGFFGETPAEPPPVMIGVQLGVLDSALSGHLGVDRESATFLTAVHEGLPAHAAGLAPYDVIVSVDGREQAGPAAIRAVLKEKKAGDTMALGVIHRGVRKDVTLTLEGYDVEKLSASKAQRVKANDAGDVFAVATAPQAPLPPLPPSIPEQYRKQIEQYMKENMAPRAIALRGSGGAAGQAESQKLLQEIERHQQDAARRAADAARRAAMINERIQSRAGASEDVKARMERLEQMLEQLMKEKLDTPNPEQPEEQGPGARS